MIKPFEEDPRFGKYLNKSIKLVLGAQIDGFEKYGDNLALIGLEGINIYCISKAQRIMHEIKKGNAPSLNNVKDLATYGILMLTMYLMETEAELDGEKEVSETTPTIPGLSEG